VGESVWNSAACRRMCSSELLISNIHSRYAERLYCQRNATCMSLLQESLKARRYAVSRYGYIAYVIYSFLNCKQ